MGEEHLGELAAALTEVVSQVTSKQTVGEQPVAATITAQWYTRDFIRAQYMYMYIVDIRLKIFHYGKYIVKVLRIQEIASKRACSYVIL